MKIINFNANKIEWKNFLKIQTEEHHHFFRTPQTFQGQEYFKTVLELIAKRSISLDSVPGLHPFINSIQNEDVRQRIWTWLEKYTPIREKISKNGDKQIFIVRAFQEKCNLIEGMAHPYYTLKPQPRKYFRGLKTLPIIEMQQMQSGTAAVPAKSDLDFQKKVVKLRLNRFLIDRSIENRNELISAIQAIPLGSSEKRGHPFLQGGSVGSRR